MVASETDRASAKIEFLIENHSPVWRERISARRIFSIQVRSLAFQSPLGINTPSKYRCSIQSILSRGSPFFARLAIRVKWVVTC